MEGPETDWQLGKPRASIAKNAVLPDRGMAYGFQAKENGWQRAKIPGVPDTGYAKMDSKTSLGRSQTHCKWEMSI